MVSPPEVLLKVLDPIVALEGKDDAVLLRVLISGRKSNCSVTYEYEMVTYKNSEFNITAMARATATTISIVAQLIANCTIDNRGVFLTEHIVHDIQYI